MYVFVVSVPQVEVGSACCRRSPPAEEPVFQTAPIPDRGKELQLNYETFSLCFENNFLKLLSVLDTVLVFSGFQAAADRDTHSEQPAGALLLTELHPAQDL